MRSLDGWGRGGEGPPEQAPSVVVMSDCHIAVVIPVLNGAAFLPRLLGSLSTQTLKHDVLVVDSDSCDASVEIALRFEARVDHIARETFNHGGTRQMMVDRYPQYDVYIFLTQDVYLPDSTSLSSLVEWLEKTEIGAVFGRQLPHSDATLWAEHARSFNYPAEVCIKSFEDRGQLGIKTPFISNSFAAYRRDSLLSVGGFPEDVILAEDMFVAARLLIAGWKVAYAADACCHHSHNYTLLEEFRRYFDQGVFHSRETWIREYFGTTGGEGVRYVGSELRFLGLKRLSLWPVSILRNACKFFGYHCGMRETSIPKILKPKLSMHPGFWENECTGSVEAVDDVF